MKVLIVFYSLEGNTKLVANIIADILKADVLELKTKKVYPKEGFKKFFFGGKSIIFHEKPELICQIPKLDKYDTIFIGTPIWAGSFASPILSFIKKTNLDNKKLAFFACNKGGGAEKCFSKLAKIYSNNKILGTVEFIEPVNSDINDLKIKVNNWLNVLNN